MKKFIYFILFILLIVIIFLFYNLFNNNNMDIELYYDSKNNIYNVKYSDEYDIYASKYQKYIEKLICKKKNDNYYSFDNPLIVLNPYQSINNGIYIYFNTNDYSKLKYTISISDNKIPDYSNELVGGYSNEHEGIIVGLMQGFENDIHLELVDKNNEIIKENNLRIEIISDDEFINSISISDIGNLDNLSPGLFALFGVNKVVNNNLSKDLGFYDNNGILRLSFFGQSGAEGKTVQFTDDGNMLFVIKNDNGTSLVKMNRFGKIINLYNKFLYSHEFLYKDDKVYYIRSSTDSFYELDLKSSKTKKLIDFKEYLDDIYKLSNSYYYNNYPDADDNNQNWLHINSFSFVNDNDIIFSSRERSTIFYISKIFDKPEIKYIIGPEVLWDYSNYKNLLYNQKGNFNIQLGQHTVRIEHDSNLKDSQYYIYMFNNNSAHSKAVEKNDWFSKYDNVGNVSTINTENIKSKFYKYLIDENEKSFELIQTFDTDYCSGKGSVQKYKGNYVTGNGNSLSFSEYDINGNLIIKFNLNDIYNVESLFKAEKYNFNNIFFNDDTLYLNQSLKVNYSESIKQNSFFKFDKNIKTIYGINLEPDGFEYYDDTYFDTYSTRYKEITIPSEIDGVKVKRVTGLNLKNVEHVIFEDGIVEIGDYCFVGANNLKKLTIPNSLNKISSKAKISEKVTIEKLQ